MAPTDHELRVFATVLTTGSYADAAQRLGLPTHRVRYHVHRLYAKTGALDKGTAAIALGWCQVPEELLEGGTR